MILQRNSIAREDTEILNSFNGEHIMSLFTVKYNYSPVRAVCESHISATNVEHHFCLF